MSGARRSAVQVVAVRGLGAVLQAAFLLLLAGRVPIDDFGFFAFVYAALGIVRMLGPLGLDQATMRGIAAARARSTAAFPAATVAWSHAAVAGTSGAAALLACAAGRIAGLSTADAALAACCIPLMAHSGLLIGQVRGLGAPVHAQWPESLLFPALLAGALLLGEAAPGRTDLLAALGGAALATCLAYLALLLALSRSLERCRNPVSPRALLREGGGIASALALTALASRAPVLVAAPLLGLAGAALVEIAVRFGTLASLITTSVAATYAPRFAALAREGDEALLRRAVREASTLAAIPAAGLALALIVLMPMAITRVLPDEYGESYAPTLAFALAATVNACFGLWSNAMLMSGRARLVSAHSLAQLLLFGAAVVPLAALFGATGIGLAAVAGALVRDFGLFLRQAGGPRQREVFAL